MRRVIPVLVGGLCASSAFAAPSSELLGRLERLQSVGSVLYIAAHPDDENTRLLAWLVGERGLDVTYLSLTRGGGGQNLVGSEQSELLGVLRTDELLAARSIDGAQQRFTRARDFGYSKSAQEALAVWGHEQVLEDVVRVVREVRPDVIITRFGATDRSHGHHVASAILAGEAFEKAADPGYLPGVPVHRVDRLVRNESHWRIDEDTDTSGWLSLDVGTYDPLTGRSWGEVAAAARTMHKSQGFGSAPSYGPQLEYFSAVAGQVPSPGQDLFSGLDLSWSRIQGGAAVDKLLAKAIKRFDPAHPERVLPILGQAYQALAAIDDPRVERSRQQLATLLLSAAGLHVTARAKQPSVVPEHGIDVEVTALLRNPASVQWRERPLRLHEPVVEQELMSSTVLTRAPWLSEPPTAALYTSFEDRTSPLSVPVEMTVGGTALAFDVPVLYAWTDPVHGERTQPVEVLPPVTATFASRTRLVPAGSTVTLPLQLRSSVGDIKGMLHLSGPDGTEVEPTRVPFGLTDESPEQTVAVQVVVGEARGPITAQVEVSGKRWSFDRTVIDHPHVPRRTVLRSAAVELVPVQLDRGSTQRVGYLQGSGDAVPDALRDLGYTVELVDEAAVRSGALDAYDTLVLGIRAFNTHPGVFDNRAALYEWVERGGRLIVQYNTSNRWKDLGDVGPRPLTIDRGRVTDETAALVPIDPDSPVLVGPNRLVQADYAGWVQERGLYFAETWDPAYRPVFRTHDAGEEPLEGSLLILPHGEGVFVYTGLSFFRQLPAGVPGAARLLANLLALEPR